MNKVCLLGRLTKDIELRYTTTNNTAVTQFTIAVNRKFKKEGQPEADFISCVAWTKTAEFLHKYFSKGQQLAITGRIQTRNWEDNEGKKHYATEVIAEDVFFAESKKDNNQKNTNENNETNTFYPQDDEELPF